LTFCALFSPRLHSSLNLKLKDLIEKSLNHPKLKAVSAALDDAITDYRCYKIRWEDIRQERSVEKAADGAVPERWIDGAEDVDGTNEKISFHHWKNRRKKRLRASSVDGVEGASRTQCKAGRDDNHAGASGVFVDSLGGNKVVANKMAQYGPAAMEVGGFRVEKNRMGQRARKAKAMAMEVCFDIVGVIQLIAAYFLFHLAGCLTGEEVGFFP